MKHLFKLREGTMPCYSLRDGPTFAQPESRHAHPQFHFVDGEETIEGLQATVVDHLKQQDHLEHYHPSRLEDLLDGSADEVAEAIREGGADDILDAALFAEREHEDRQAVAAAIAERSDELATQEAQSEQTESLTPNDLAV